MRLLLSVAVFLAAGAAQAATVAYTTSLSGPNEDPPNASPGAGTGFVFYDDIFHTLRVTVSFSGLTGNTTNAHIHCCTASPFAGTVGVATATPTFPGFPAGVTAGSYDATFDLTQAASWNPSFVTASGSIAAAEARLVAGLDDGTAYLNIHSSAFGGGEIRGFLVPTPEPSTILLTLIPAALLWLKRRPRQF